MQVYIPEDPVPPSKWISFDNLANAEGDVYVDAKCDREACKTWNCANRFLKCNEDEDAPLQLCNGACEYCKRRLRIRGWNVSLGFIVKPSV